MRITHVKHAQKPQTCGKCGDKIKPSRDQKVKTKKRIGKKKVYTQVKIVRILGDSYIWIKPKNGGKRVRCSKPDCRFRTSDMVGGKMSGVYGAQETAEDAVADWPSDGSSDDLKNILEEMATSVKEVAEEYGESADNMESAFPNGSPTIEECREKQEALDGWGDELEQVDFTDFEPVEKSDEEQDVPRMAFDAFEAALIKKSPGSKPKEWTEAQRELWTTFVDAVKEVIENGLHEAAKIGFVAFMAHAGTVNDKRSLASFAKQWDKADETIRGPWRTAVDAVDLAKNLDRDEEMNDDGQTREEWAEEQREAANEVIGNCPV